MFGSIARFIARTYTDPDTGWAWLAKFGEKRRARKEELLEAERKVKEEASLYKDYKDYPPDWLERRERIRKKYDFTCQICGRRKDFWNLHVHHIIPRSKGGNHALENLTLLCKKCHGKQPGHRHLSRQKLYQKVITPSDKNRKLDSSPTNNTGTFDGTSVAQFKSVQGVKAICSICGTSYTITLRRYETKSICPHCGSYQTVDIDWE